MELDRTHAEKEGKWPLTVMPEAIWRNAVEKTENNWDQLHGVIQGMQSLRV